MILSKNKNFNISINQLLDESSLQNEIENILIVVPTNRRLRELKKNIISRFTDFPIARINIETFTTLTSKLLKQIKPFTTLSEAASTVLIKETCDELKLKYFAAYSNGIPFGTLDKIKNVISEYKKHGISVEKLLEESKKLEGGEQLKAVDIASIFKSYNNKCKNLSAYEIGDIYTDIISVSQIEISDAFKKIFKSVNSILIDGFDEFTNLEIEIIERLNAIVDSNLSITFDYFSNNENLFSHLAQIYIRLSQLGFNEIKQKTFDEKFNFREKLRNELFSEIEFMETEFKDKITKIIAKNRSEEIETIAKIIKGLIFKNNVQPENICVVFNIIGNYSSKVRDVFGKYGIPINLTDRISLKSSPSVIAAISLLELIEGDFHYNDIVRVLSNGFIKFENIDLNNLISVANELKITIGKNNWELIISDAKNLIKYRENLSSLDQNIVLQNYDKALADIKKIDSTLSLLKRKNTVDDFIQNFIKVLLHLKLPCTVLEDSNNKEEEHVKSLTVLLKTLNEVLYLVKKDDGEEKKYPLSFYLDHIRTICNWARFNVKEKSDYGVLVTSLNEIRGLNYDYLFVGGMCDGDFPTKYSPEIFFSGSFRKQEIIHQIEEKFHFYQTLCSWNKKLYLSIPKNDKDSELVESTFIKDFENIIKISEYNYSDIKKIFSKEELLVEFGKNINNNILEEEISKAGIDSNEILRKSEIRNFRTANYLEENYFNGFLNLNEINISSFLNDFSQKEFSISQLETFAKCPFKYFSERILKVKPIEEPTEEVEPLELGNVLHSILFEFYKKVTEENVPINSEGTREFGNLKKILFEIAENKISNLNINSPIAFFEKEKILGIDENQESSILYKFLQEETNEKSEFSPKYFEYSFGNFPNKKNKLVNPIEIGDVKLRGTIDRIDIDEQNSFFNIVDYKLKGKKPTNSELHDGLSLQLPVYLIAGKQILQEEKNENFEEQDMIIYSLNFKDEKFGKSPINLKVRGKLSTEEKIEMNDDLIKSTKEKISLYHKKIKDGKFHLSSLENRDDKVCRFCDFQSFCRVKEVFE
ncbi:MAG: exodeoxyribonuclease V subunit gamma [Ignavibacteriae bacterium]|nr:exodeoxyribonuclease V subunit gamma [Ignavibacteriota bacterium]